MKLAVISDVHGNVPALESVLDDITQWQPDELVVNGDLVNRGPYSLACMRMVQSRFPAARLFAGNHEHYVLHCADTTADPGSPTHEIDRFAYWTVARLGAAVDELRSWGDHWDLTGLEGGASLHITHGSRLGNRDGISVRTTDEELSAKLGDPRDLFIGSHTHKPLQRRFNGTLVVNTGSVGQSMDGDARAAYGRFTLQQGGWHAEVKRVAYDKVQAEKDFVDSGFLEEGGPIAPMILLELQQCRAHLGPWRRAYLDSVKAEHISVRASMEAYLSTL